ncbi:hypothetical protein D3C75_1256950 [compost metagenome]
MRTSVIVKMIVHSPAGAAALLASCRNFAQVAKIIVSQQDRYIIKYVPVLQSFCLSCSVPIFLDFLVDRQNLRRMLQIVFLQ